MLPLRERNIMSRRTRFVWAMQRIVREGARIQRQAEAARKRELRERVRRRREHDRQTILLQKEQHVRYLADRKSEADDSNRELQERIESLEHILESALSINSTIPFSSLKRPEDLPQFRPPAALAESISPPKPEDYLKLVRPIGLFEKLFARRARYERDLQQAEASFKQGHDEYIASEAKRVDDLRKLQENHTVENERLLADIREQNTEVDELERAYRDGDPPAVIGYYSMVLERSHYPDGFPQNFRVAYMPDPNELVIDYELPTVQVVPTVAEYRYVKSKDSIEERARKVSEIKDVYQEIVAGIALRTIHEVLTADQANTITVVVFNGFVNTADPATGKDIKPYLISVRVTRERFIELDLGRIDKKACLRNLGALVSSRAAELLPVKPLIEFDMVDKRFVEASDVLADLESRPNLMDLTPFAFETLVSNLFSKMGLETKQTRSSRDGGIDAVAFDTRPVIGGKVVIQAKRYRHTVGVSAVRDLFGTMNHEGANKGILVTTSSFGPDAYDFIKGKPVELIDGGGLLYYLEQAGIKARIVFPVESEA
jgi:restriction system protein